MATNQLAVIARRAYGLPAEHAGDGGAPRRRRGRRRAAGRASRTRGGERRTVGREADGTRSGGEKGRTLPGDIEGPC